MNKFKDYYFLEHTHEDFGYRYKDDFSEKSLNDIKNILKKHPYDYMSSNSRQAFRDMFNDMCTKLVIPELNHLKEQYQITHICAIPQTENGFNSLPLNLSIKIAENCNLINFSQFMQWNKRSQLKLMSLSEKRDYINAVRIGLNRNYTDETVVQFGERFIKNSTILIIDDLIQSGTTMDRLEDVFYKYGAKQVIKFALIKAINDDDNLSTF